MRHQGVASPVKLLQLIGYGIQIYGKNAEIAKWTMDNGQCSIKGKKLKNLFSDIALEIF